MLELSQLQNINYDLWRDDSEHIVGQQIALRPLRTSDQVSEIFIALLKLVNKSLPVALGSGTHRMILHS
jgi:hypothetical protein